MPSIEPGSILVGGGVPALIQPLPDWYRFAWQSLEWSGSPVILKDSTDVQAYSISLSRMPRKTRRWLLQWIEPASCLHSEMSNATTRFPGG